MVKPGVKAKYRYIFPTGKFNVRTVHKDEVFTYVPGKKETRYDTTHRHPELEEEGYDPQEIITRKIYNKKQLEPLTVKTLVKIANIYGIETKGLKKADIIKKILKEQKAPKND